MIIGIPKEIKEHEYRVGVTPSGVKELLKEGHRVLVEDAAGTGSGFSDEDYKDAGAVITDKGRLFGEAALIVKVKEPLPAEYDLFREGQALFTYLHLASAPDLVKMLLGKNIAAFAYETLEVNGAEPLLMPMSEIAGKMAPVVAAFYLQRIHGGMGVLATGVDGVRPARFLILGAGTVGTSALQVAHGMGADVTVINRGKDKLDRINEMYGGKVKTVILTAENLEAEAVNSDVIIGAIYVTGARTPKLISRGLVSRMKNGSVLVDVSVDQGGCSETTKPMTHGNPVYTVDGVIHYCVANMPGAYPRTATLALTKRTLEYIKMLAATGIEKAAAGGGPLRSAMNTYKGKITHKAVADSMSPIS